MGADAGSPPVRVEVLGPLRLFVDGAAVDVPGPKRRAVLALLALAGGRTVTVDDLVDALWPGEVPESGRQALHTHVSRLRGHLGAAAPRLQTRHDGYRLDLGPDDLDLTRARTLLATARTATDDGPAALASLRAAHALWHGPVLADLTDVEPIAAAVRGCMQLRQEVTDALVSSAIDAGQAGEVLELAGAAHAADQLREPAVLLLMRVLAASGRAPQALGVGREYRRRLADETGLDPSAALGELERDIAGGAAGPPTRQGPAGKAPTSTTSISQASARRAPAAPDLRAPPATRLIGREAQVTSLHRLLAAERLVTLVGAGGVGKTRVALEVAHASEAASVLLLAPVTDPAVVPNALAAALGLEVVQGDVLAASVALLADRPGLLVIDNCEHLLEAVRDTVEVILSSCPRLSVLATSREPLGLAAEYAFRLTPLPLPGSGENEELARIPSVAVFLDRAARVRPGPPPSPADLRLIADIVRRLDGMPLAIELAAGRLSTFSYDDLHRRLDRSLDLLGGGRPSGDARHRTLRATVEWSYQLLAEDERRLFRHLAVFVDGVDLGTAEWLADDLGLGTDPGAVLSRLVDTSMIEAEFEGGTRYRMLDTLRAFGLDRLTAAGEDVGAGGRLLRWAVRVTGEIEAGLVTEREPEADTALRRELANLRAAWRLARDRGAVHEPAVIVTALLESITYRDLVEIRGWAEELAGDPALAGHANQASVLAAAAEAAYHRGDLATAERRARAGLEQASSDAGSWICLSVLAVVALARGRFLEVVELSLAAAAVAPRPRDNLGVAALAMAYAGDLEQARALRAQGGDDAASPSMRSWGAYVSGEIETAAGRPDLAEPHYRSALEQARSCGATFLAGVASVGLLSVLARVGRTQDALRGYRDVVDGFARTGNWTHLWVTLRNLADLLRLVGDPEPAAALDDAADQAPDAPPVSGARPKRAAADGQSPTRTEVLALARDAIERNLTRG